MIERDNSENMCTGHRPRNTPRHVSGSLLELKVVKDIPMVRTPLMLPWKFLLEED